MSGITLKNPVINSVPIAINLGRKNIDVSGTSLSTGLKTNNDVVSSFLGRNLNDRSKILNQFYKNVGYGSNIAQTAQEGLNSIARTLVEMQGIINSVGGSETSIRTLNDIFQQKLLQVEQQTNSVKFDGVKLLTGEFGSDPTIKSKYNTKIVDVRKTGIGSGTLFEGAGTRAVKIIDVQNIANIKAGDTISLHDVSFKMVQNKELVTSESDILIGTSEEQTVSNIATALKNHPSESLRIYNVTTRNKQVIITQRSASTSQIPLIVKSENNGFLDNSDPSTYSFLLEVNNTLGSKLTISDVTFEFVANGTAGNDPTKVEIKTTNVDTVKTLRKAIENHPITKDLIDQNMLSFKNYSVYGLEINSVFNKNILGFKAEFSHGDITHNIFKTSKTTRYAYEMKFIQPSIGGEIVRFVKPNGIIQNFNLIPLTVNNLYPSVLDGFLQDHDIGIHNLNGIIHKEKLCISNFWRNRSITFYSNYDLKLQYIPVGVNRAIKISPAPISMADVSVIKPAVNVSNIRNIEGFIGTTKVSVKVMAQATSVAGDGLASILYRQVKGDVSLPTIPADDDIATILHVDIAGRTFQSIIWQGAGDNLNNRELVFTEPSTGETFSINTKDINSNITTLESTIDTLAKPIERLLSSTEFAQIRDLDIDNSSEEIIDDSGRIIGNVDGMTVSLNSTDFSNKQFEDFVIKRDPDVLGKTLFIATISGQEFVCRVRDTELKEGKSLTFSGNNGDTLTINIGKGGINSLSDPKNYKYIASAIKKSLMKIGSGIEIRTGFDLDNLSKLAISNISVTKLYRNNQNEYAPKLDLLNKESVKIAQEVITNALNLVYLARAKLQGQGDDLDRSANVISSTIGVTKDASSAYLDTNLVEAASSFATALKSILAAVSTLQAGAKVADAGLEIIKSASTI
jgi:hypothetical protein